MPAPGGPPLDAARFATLEERVEGLVEENEAMGRELLRCYEQLSLVYEITEHIANLQEPEEIEAALLRRFGAMLSAGTVIFENARGCHAIECDGSLARPVALEPRIVSELFAGEMRIVRQTGRTYVPTLTPEVAAQVGNAHLLMGALRPSRADDTQPGVVIALRDAAEADFDSGDVLASEAVLGYGGHILSNVLMLRHLQQTAVETVTALANAIDAKDNYTSGHSERVGWLAKLTGQALGLTARQLQVLEWAGLLHDVGKIGISERILNKPGRLTQDEFEEMKRHPRLSYEVLKPVASLEPVLEGVLHHHENHDGTGYPDGLRGENVPVIARILHVVDIFDALTSTRSYRQGFDLETAFEILRKESGTVTDPYVTNVFIQTFLRYAREQAADYRTRFAHVGRRGAPAPPAP